MDYKKIIIETTEAKRNALDKKLKQHGTTLTEWVNEKIDEIIEPSHAGLFYQEEIECLEDIHDENRVFDVLQEQDWAFSDSNTTYLSHNIHPYPAKYIPQIPNTLIRHLSLRGETVWDPFGGSGTTALEALLLGRQAVSSDTNPLATLIGTAKTTTLTKEEVDILWELLDKIKILCSNPSNIRSIFTQYQHEIVSHIPEIPNREKWFHQDVLLELGYLAWQIRQLEKINCQNVAKVALSKIIIRASFQDSETRYVSKPRDVQIGNTLQIYVNELSTTVKKIEKISSLVRFRKADFVTADLRYEHVVESNSIDLVVTSPPYPNATDYHLYHRFRLFWLEFDPVKLGKREIGSHLRHQKEKTGIENYIEEMGACLNNIYHGLRVGRYAILVLGDGIFKGQQYNTAEMIGERASDIGFESIGIIPRKLPEKKRSFVAAARRLKQENLLILRKPAKKIMFQISLPPYKLWEYEAKIRQIEIENMLKMNGVKLTENTISLSPLKADKLRRLTFTHSFSSHEYHREATWQAILENGDAFNIKSNRKDPKYVTHGLHPYKGKFYPQLAKSLFNVANIEAEQKLLDPFCGSGTVLLEAYLNGFHSYGFDLNPLAVKIAQAKVEILDLDFHFTEKILARFIEKLDKHHINLDYKEVFQEECWEELVSWFPERVLNKVAWIVKEFDEISEPKIKNFLEVCLSSIVRQISQQDPRDLRIRRRKEPIEDAPVRELYYDKLFEQKNRLIKFATHSNKMPCKFGFSRAYKFDSRLYQSFTDANISEESIHAVVTSPPYATALPYIDTDRLSILLLYSLKSHDRSILEKSLIGSREITQRERSHVERRIDHF